MTLCFHQYPFVGWLAGWLIGWSVSWITRTQNKRLYSIKLLTKVQLKTKFKVQTQKLNKQSRNLKNPKYKPVITKNKDTGTQDQNWTCCPCMLKTKGKIQNKTGNYKP